MTLQGEMRLVIWDVEHGACAMIQHVVNQAGGKLAMIDSGSRDGWRPSSYIKNSLGRNYLDYLFITNADQDHMSDLDGLWDENIEVSVLIRNPGPSTSELRKIKSAGGMSNDIERFLQIHGSYNQPVSEPFNSHMAGITYKAFYNTFPQFTDTNNLSCAVFIQYSEFKILFPGDLEEDGWLALLKRRDFQQELSNLTVLVASHHGRENGYCKDVFDYCHPRVVVMSDKEIAHSTQEMTPTYRQRVIDHWSDGVKVATTTKQRHVLTSRRDGWIEFRVDGDGNFLINTEKRG